MSDQVPLCVPRFDPADEAAVVAAVASGYVSGVGPEIARFEMDLATTTGVANVVGCATGTAALHLALLALGVQSGDEVAVSDVTFAATANAALYCGASLLLVDSTPTDWCIDGEALFDEVRRRAARGHQLPKAVVAVDVLGIPVNREPLKALAEDYGVLIVEDGAEALGASWSDGTMVGAFGHVAALSFNGNKIITSGNGGCVLSEDPQVVLRARHLANQARLPGVGYDHDAMGFNYRLSNLNAALGRSQLRRLPEILLEKAAIAEQYRDQLAPLGFVPAPVPKDRRPSFWLSSLLLPDHMTWSSDQVVVFLAELGVEARPLWTPLSSMKLFRGVPRIGGHVGNRLRDRGISLPCSVGTTSAEVTRVVDALKLALEQSCAAKGTDSAD